MNTFPLISNKFYFFIKLTELNKEYLNSLFNWFFMGKAKQSGTSKSILISDLDDTLRKAHVLNLFKAGINVMTGVRPFDRLRDIFNDYIEHSKRVNENHHIEFHYVSGSHPSMYNAKSWLEKHEFPMGQIFQKDKLLENVEKFKLRTIEKIVEPLLEEVKNNYCSELRLLFFGDNGEKDPKIYKEIGEYLEGHGEEVSIHIFIRDITTKATDLTQHLPTEREEGISYFLSEFDLIKNPFFEFLHPNTKSKIHENHDKNGLIPPYVVETLTQRIQNEDLDHQELGKAPKELAESLIQERYQKKAS